MKIIDKTVSLMIKAGWQLDYKAKVTPDEIEKFKEGLLCPLADYSYFLQKYGMIYLYKDRSSHSLPLKQGVRSDKLNTIQGAIDFCNNYSEWPVELIPFYADVGGNYFCFNFNKKLNELGFVVCYLHDLREYKPFKLGNDFASFLDYAQQAIPLCWEAGK